MAKFLTIAQLQKEFGITMRSLKELMQREIYEPVKSIADQAKAIAASVRKDADEGRFNGAPGPQGEPGTKGEPGNPGFSPTVHVTEVTGGYRVTITDEAGAHEYIVYDGADGEDGYTPVRGVDYWTDADKTEIVSDTETALAPALAEKQDVLIDADKQSITKTGMTTGSGWTAAEQSAARARMGLGAYELIDEITLDEEVSKVEIALPNNLISLKVIYHPGSAVASSNIMMKLRNGGTTLSGLYFTSQSLSADWDLVYVASMVLGWNGYSAIIGGNGSVQRVGTNNVNHLSNERLSMPINNIYWHNSTFPAGAKFTIYGVKA